MTIDGYQLVVDTLYYEAKGPGYRTTGEALGDMATVVLADGSRATAFVVSYASTAGTVIQYSRISITITDPQGVVFRTMSIEGAGGKPALSALADGGFLVTWSGQVDTTSNVDDCYLARVDLAEGLVWLQRLNGISGEPAGSGSESNAVATELANGNIAVAWQGTGFGNSDIYYQVLSPGGQVILDDTLANVSTANEQRNPAIVALQDGTFAIIWEDGTGLPPSTNFDIRARFFNASGQPLSGPIDVHAEASGGQFHPSAALLSGGDIIVAWSNEGAIAAQRLSPTGQRIGNEVQVTTLGGSAFFPIVVAHPEGGFTVGWRENVVSQARSFNISDAPVEGPFTLFGASVPFALAIESDGDLVSALGVGNRILVRTFAAEERTELAGTSLDDLIYGNSLDNRIDGSFGRDELRGEAGADVLHGGPGEDHLDGGEGIDTATYAGDFGGVFINLTLGRGYTNFAFGDTYDSVENVIGSSWDDFLIGDPAVNVLDGGAGNDTIIGAVGADVLIGGAGIDLLSYEDNSGTVFVNLLTGMGYNNAAQGDTFSGFENVIGGLFDDTIIGDNGANRLDGAMGADTLVGNGGADTFVFAHAPGAASGFVHPNSSANVDTIFDFVSGEDKLEINAAAFGGGLTPGSLAAGAFVIGSAASDADDRFVYDQINGNIYFDADGSGAGAQVLMAILPNHDVIAASDFVIV